MKQLIEITPSLVGNERIQTVNARELHSFLECGRDFSNWIKSRIEDYGFIEGEDYFSLAKFVEQTGRGGHNKIEYFISIDMAKELSMVERNEKGKQARQYFIACEKQLKSGNKASVAHLKYRLQLIEKLEKERNSIKRQAIYDQLKLVSDSVGLPTPEMDSLGYKNIYEELMAQFWEFFSDNDDEINHAKDHSIIAINAGEVCELFSRYCMKKISPMALRQAFMSDENYIDNATVKSRITQKTVRCYRFHRR